MIFCRGAERGYPFFKHKKSKLALSSIHLGAWMQLSRDLPLLPWLASSTGRGGGSTNFWQRLWGGTKILRRLQRRRVCIFAGSFHEKYHSPPNKKFWTVLITDPNILQSIRPLKVPHMNPMKLVSPLYIHRTGQLTPKMKAPFLCFSTSQIQDSNQYLEAGA